MAPIPEPLLNEVEEYSTLYRYERYLNMDDEQLFSHFLSLRPQFSHYTEFVQRAVLNHLQGRSSCAIHRWEIDYSPHQIFLCNLHITTF